MFFWAETLPVFNHTFHQIVSEIKEFRKAVKQITELDESVNDTSSKQYSAVAPSSGQNNNTDLNKTELMHSQCIPKYLKFTIVCVQNEAIELICC